MGKAKFPALTPPKPLNQFQCHAKYITTFSHWVDVQNLVGIDSTATVCARVATGAAVIGGTRPPTFWLGGRKGKCPPLIAQNAYLGEELKGLCIIKIQFLFSFRGAMPLWPPDQGLCPWTPLGAPPHDPPPFRRNRRHCVKTRFCVDFFYQHYTDDAW